MKSRKPNWKIYKEDGLTRQEHPSVNYRGQVSKPAWPLYESAAYLVGRGLHFGSADTGRWFHKRANDGGKYCITIDPRRGKDVDADLCGWDLDAIASRSLDYVILGPVTTEHLEPAKLASEAVGKLRHGGHLILFLPEAVDWRAWVQGKTKWRLKQEITRGENRLVILKKGEGSKKLPAALPPLDPAGRACIARYGAIGDQIQITALIRALEADGYEVTVNVNAGSAPVLENNPRIKHLVVQERDVIFNPDLANYWEYWKPRYEKYINLSESIEGSLLKTEGRPDYYTPQAWRHDQCNKNYVDRILELGGYPGADTRAEFYPTDGELTRARHFRESAQGRFVIGWLTKGSSYHKQYPLVHHVLNRWLSDKTDAVAALFGGKDADNYKLPMHHPLIIDLIGDTPLRDSLTLLRECDLVIGPETGLMNAVGWLPVPKILMLSHSAPSQLERDWDNTIVMTPDTQTAECYPCHQMHYSRESCPLNQLVSTDGETVYEGPACTTAISADRVLNAIDKVYSLWKKARTPSPLVTV